MDWSDFEDFKLKYTLPNTGHVLSSKLYKNIKRNYVFKFMAIVETFL